MGKWSSWKCICHNPAENIAQIHIFPSLFQSMAKHGRWGDSRRLFLKETRSFIRLTLLETSDHPKYSGNELQVDNLLAQHHLLIPGKQSN